MIILKWAKYPESDIVKYKIYKSILGFRAIKAAPSLLLGKTLSLKINDGLVQNILFHGTANVVDQINASIVDAKAYLSIEDPLYFYFRSNLREEPAKVEILACDSLTVLGLTPHTVLAQSENFLIGELVANQQVGATEQFSDQDGSVYDFYAISSVNSVNDESLKTPFKQPVNTGGSLCIVEGFICDLQGSRVPDAEVKITLQQAPKDIDNAFLTKEPIVTYSGPDGKISIPVLRGALVKIEISEVSFSRNVTIPDKAFVLINDLLVDGTYQYAEDN